MGLLALAPATGLLSQAPPPTAAAAEDADAREPVALPLRIDELVESIRKEREVVALGGALFDSEGLLAIGASGLRALGSEARVTTEDPWHLGSNGKAITATLAALAVQGGEIGFETSPATVLAGLAPDLHHGWQDTSLGLLLQNRGGAPTRPDRALMRAAIRFRASPPLQLRRQVFRTLLSAEPAYPPASRFVYSNHGFALAGAMLEQHLGLPFESLIQERVAQPLGLTSLGFGAAGVRGEAVPSAPYGHRKSLFLPWTAVPPGPQADNGPEIAPAGTMHLSMPDWVRFLRLHLGARVGELKLSKPLMQRLHTPAPPSSENDDQSGREDSAEKPSYAMGFGVADRDWGGRVLVHTGSNTMNYAVVWLAPEKGFGVLAVCNQGGAAAAGATDALVAKLIQRHRKR